MTSTVVVVVLWGMLVFCPVYSEIHVINFSDKQLFLGDSCEIKNYEINSGVCKHIKDCSSVLANLKSRIYNHTVCAFEQAEQIVCCPNEDGRPLGEPLAHEGEHCIYKTETGEMGILRKDTDCPSTNTYKLFNGLVCCPNAMSQSTYDECSNIDELLRGIEFIGPKCYDPISKISGTCRPQAQAPIDFRATTEYSKCGTYCCQEFYCYPDRDTFTQSISFQKCTDQLQYSYATQQSIPNEKFSSVSCNSSTLHPKSYISNDNSTGCALINIEAKPYLAIHGYTVSDAKIFWNCAGALISESFVLSSASCLNHEEFGAVTKIRLGGNAAETHRIFDVKRLFQHPNYKHDIKYSDVGVIELAHPVVFNNFVYPACLPMSAEMPKQVQTIGVTGGHINNNYNIAELATMQVTQNVIAPNECNIPYENSIDVRFGNGFDESSQVCLALNCEIHRACQSNMGRLIFNNEGHFGIFNEIYGVSSRGDLCNNGVSEIYTKIFPFVTWIEGIVWGTDFWTSLSRFGDEE